MYISTLFTVAKNGDTQMSVTDKGINKMWYSHKWNIIWPLVNKRNESLMHAMTWMNHENSMLNRPGIKAMSCMIYMRCLK